jgi:hypothetical protein
LTRSSPLVMLTFTVIYDLLQYRPLAVPKHRPLVPNSFATVAERKSD